MRHHGQPRGWRVGRVSERQVRATREWWMAALATEDPSDLRIPNRSIRRQKAFRPKIQGGR